MPANETADSAHATEYENPYESAVAIVGMSGRFPGAPDVATLWRNLLDGTAGLRAITDEELTAAGVDPATAADPHYVRVGGPVDGIDRFDAAAFGFSPREVETMEPQHRLFLESCWEALEGAGYPPVEPVGPGGAVGVFGGSAFPDYLLKNVPHLMSEPGGSLLVAVGNERDSLTSLVAYKLGLRGPSVSVQTFCSTSLVAVHLACQSLLTFECGLALAGGAALPLPQPTGYHHEPGGIHSPTGRVRCLDASADGSVVGSGVAVVALKRMADALADGDLVHAVILGSAVNNDGPERVGYTAPGVDGQAAVIGTALEVADVKPESIGYIECHATGTPLGDTIEVAALSRVFTAAPETPCVLSSLKPSIGHLDRASGVTGLIRAALNLSHAVLPGTAGFRTPNPALAAASGRFTVLPQDRPWPAGPEPRRAGVSSFGLGGTNAHVVLEEAPARAPRSPYPGPHLLTFSGGDRAALAATGERLAAHLLEHPELDLADVAHTLQVSRGHFALRRAVVCRDTADAVAALADPSRWIEGETTRHDPRVLLVAGERASDRWLAELASATRLLLPGETIGPGTPLAVLAEGLRGIGVRVVAADDAGSGTPTTLVVQPDDGTAAGPDAGAAEWLVATIARLWLAGAAVEWSALHRGEGRRVELPTYPFQRSRYWATARPGWALTEPAPTGRVADPAQWTHLPTWRPHPLPTADLDERLRAAGPWLVLASEQRGEALADRLSQAGAEVVTARPEDPGTLADLLGSQFVAARTIVHGFSLASAVGEGAAHFAAELARGARSVQDLVGALNQDPEPPPVELVLLTSGACSVVGTDLHHPEHAALGALAPSIAQENPHLACRHIDIDLDADLEQSVEQVLAAMVHPHRGPAAVRGGDLWVRGYDRYRLDPPDPERPLFRDGETVLITGGLGDVGLALARHLADTYGCRLVLTARTALPPRERWPALADGTDRAARHIRNVLDLEARGAQVLAVGADVGDEQRMRAVLAAATERFGGIDAVVHAAGARDPKYFAPVHLADEETCAAHYRAKVDGFHVLQAVLGDRAPDRRITLSSIATVLGGIALGPFAAANAALDAYARQARLRGTGHWCSIAWDAWGVDPVPVPVALAPEAARRFEMSPAEGVQVFERVLAAADRIGRTVISTGPIAPRIEQWVTGAPAVGDAEDPDRERHPRPDLATAYREPAAGLERSIADIWAATLGVDRVGADDDFLELGGHSLLAIQLAARIRAAVSGAGGLPATALVEHPTVRGLAELLGAG
jgi:acyl transferase domain-containing protein